MQIPKYIDPAKFASHNMHWHGELPLAGMARLAQACHVESLSGTVTFDLQGQMGWENLPYIEGHFESELPLICQRCMLPFAYKVKTHAKLSPVKNELDAEKLPSDVDGVIVTDDEVDLLSMIEDELLLCVPIVALHEVENCLVKDDHWSDDKQILGQKVSEEKDKTENPFAKLRGVITHGSSTE